jgi:hypothetical protein
VRGIRRWPECRAYLLSEDLAQHDFARALLELGRALARRAQPGSAASRRAFGTGLPLTTATFWANEASGAKSSQGDARQSCDADRVGHR